MFRPEKQMPAGSSKNHDWPTTDIIRHGMSDDDASKRPSWESPRFRRWIKGQRTRATVFSWIFHFWGQLQFSTITVSLSAARGFEMCTQQGFAQLVIVANVSNKYISRCSLFGAMRAVVGFHAPGL